MAAPALIESYKKLRKEVVWSLIAADTAPETIALLQTLLFDRDRRLKESVVIDRLQRILDDMRTESVSREQVIAILGQWRKNQYILRTLTDRDEEPHYELSAGAFDAISFISSQTQTRVAPTGSRLELLIHAIKKLTDDTDGDINRRIERLQAEKKLLEKRIIETRNGQIPLLSAIEIRSQVQDILSMIENMDSDFLRVRDRFMTLANGIQAEILQSDDTRGAVLEKIFSGYDNIRESDEGKTFESFYRFLYEELSSRQLDSLISTLEDREFWTKIASRDQDQISELVQHLSERTRETQQVMKRLASGLRQFVQSREYLQNRRMQELLDETRKLSVAVAEMHNTRQLTEVYSASQPYVSLSSLSEGSLFDPAEESSDEILSAAPIEVANITEIASRISSSEINYALLIAHIEEMLKSQSTVSIGELLERFPAKQGLATIVGYLHLAVERAEFSENQSEVIQWNNRLDEAFKATIPVYRFTRANLNENGKWNQ